MARPSKEIIQLRNNLFPEGLYYCGKCQVVKPLLEFGRDKANRHGIKAWCKPCMNNYNHRSEQRIKAEIGETAFRARKNDHLAKWKKNTRPKRLEHFRRQDKESNLKRLYGITIADFNRLLAEQDGRCAICSTVKPQSKWHVDHCHNSNEVRGILCNLCNVGIGALKENIDAIRMAEIYLRPRSAQ